MKIVWLAAECPFPPNTGGRMLTWKRMEKLSKCNEIYLFSIVDSRNDFKYTDEIKKICTEVQLYRRKKTFLKLLQSLFYPFPAVSRWNKAMRQDLIKACSLINPDYIFVDMPQMYGNLKKYLRNHYRIVLHEQNIEFTTFNNLAKMQNDFIKKTIYKIVARQMEKYEKKLYRENSIDLYTFVSPSDKAFFEKEYQKLNTYLFPIGCEIALLNQFEEKDCIVFIGNFTYGPNEEGAIWFLKKVWNMILAKIPTAHFWIVGKEPSKQIKEIAKSYNNVTITGSVDSVNEYYAKASVVIVPLFSGGGAKVKLVEALGHGKLVVSTREGVRGTNFSNGKDLFIADDPREFSEYCINILLDSSNFDTIRVNAINKVKKNYSWDTLISNFEEYLDNREK